MEEEIILAKLSASAALFVQAAVMKAKEECPDISNADLWEFLSKDEEFNSELQQDWGGYIAIEMAKQLGVDGNGTIDHKPE